MKKSQNSSKHCLPYVPHTSATAVIPKIVRVPRECIIRNIQHFQVFLKLHKKMFLLLDSPLTFDPSIVEIFVALSSGGCLFIVPISVKELPSKLAVILFSHQKVTILQVQKKCLAQSNPCEEEKKLSK